MGREYKFDENLRNDLAQAVVLYKMLEQDYSINSRHSGGDRALKQIMEAGVRDELWEIKKGTYQISPRGKLLWENWKARWWDFLANFDVFAGVDLKEGVFAGDNADWDAKDDDGNLIWEDLRVAVCMRKIELSKSQGIKTELNPLTIVFLAFLSEGRIEQSRDWQFEIAFDSIFWSDIENVVNSSIRPEELGYDGVSWEEVIDDIIGQGMKEASRRWEEDDDDDEIAPSEAFDNEDDVRREYGDYIHEYGYNPGFFYYSPYWHIRDTALAVGAIGLCWAIF